MRSFILRSQMNVYFEAIAAMSWLTGSARIIFVYENSSKC
jgi:hypothetical protein